MFAIRSRWKDTRAIIQDSSRIVTLEDRLLTWLTANFQGRISIRTECNEIETIRPNLDPMAAISVGEGNSK